MPKHDDSVLKCSFCGKSQDQVKKLIADQVEIAKVKYGVKTSEFISDRPGFVDGPAAY